MPFSASLQGNPVHGTVFRAVHLIVDLEKSATHRGQYKALECYLFKAI